MTTTTSTTTAKLICPECRHENEAERIYCHSCGTRLDRSAVKIKKEPIDDTRKRVRRMFDPQRAKLRALFFDTSKLILGAFVAALVTMIFLPPDVPPPSKEVALVSQIRFDLEKMATKHQPPQVHYSEAEANGFLSSALRTKQASLNHPLLDFKRAVVAFREKSCGITIERSLFGYSVYTSCNYSPSVIDGRLVAPTSGGWIGRLPIHPKIAQFMGTLFSDVWAALNNDQRSLAKLGAIEFHDKTVVLTSAP